ncbi:MAG: hypothetical protein WCD76_07575, partial [Pyrinomonadaceae bacterium]
PLPFSDEVIDIIYSAAGGTPRDILRICGYAYEISQVGGDPEVSRELAEQAIEHERQIMDDDDEALSA